MLFRDRRDAGEQLSAALRIYQDRRPHILAIPRGGVVVGYEVAVALRAPLDVVIPRKLRAPGNPELAIGAVAHDGTVYLDEALVAALRVADDFVCLHRPPVFYAVGQFYENFAQTTDDEVIALLRQRETELKSGTGDRGLGTQPQNGADS